MITAEIKKILDKEKIIYADFQKLLMRLLDQGVILREDSQKEQECYDLFLRVENVVVDFFSLLNMQVLHDSTFQFVRVYPPGALIPGAQELYKGEYKGFRKTLNHYEIALLLSLRVLYEQKVLEGNVNERGHIEVTIEDIHITFTQALNKELPEKQLDKRAMYQTLKNLKIIQYQIDDLDIGEGTVTILPIICSYSFDFVDESESVDSYQIDTLDKEDNKDFKKDAANNLKIDQIQEIDKTDKISLEEKQKEKIKNKAKKQNAKTLENKPKEKVTKKEKKEKSTSGMDADECETDVSLDRM